jgi:hypothetical protein
VQVLADWANAEIQAITIPKLHQMWTRHLLESSGCRGDQSSGSVIPFLQVTDEVWAVLLQ